MAGGFAVCFTLCSGVFPNCFFCLCCLPIDCTARRISFISAAWHYGICVCADTCCGALRKGLLPGVSPAAPERGDIRECAVNPVDFAVMGSDCCECVFYAGAYYNPGSGMAGQCFFAWACFWLGEGAE